MTEIAVVATFVAKPGNEDKLKEVLQGIVAPTPQRPARVQYDLHRLTSRSHADLCFSSDWKSEASLAEHNQTPHIQALSKTLPDLIERGEINVVAKL